MRRKEPLVTTRELAEYFGVTTQTIFNWRQEGLPFLRLGNRMRYDMDEAIEWLKERGEEIERKQEEKKAKNREE